MKLTNLELFSTLRLTQPIGAEEAQTLDIRFSLDGNYTTISPEFYELFYYDLINGYVDGTSAKVKFVYFDATDSTIAYTENDATAVKFDKIETETGVETVLDITSTFAEAVDDVYIHYVNAYYVVEGGTDMLLFNSRSVQYNVFAETIPSTTLKGVKIPGSVGDTAMNATMKFYWKT